MGPESRAVDDVRSHVRQLIGGNLSDPDGSCDGWNTNTLVDKYKSLSSKYKSCKYKFSTAIPTRARLLQRLFVSSRRRLRGQASSSTARVSSEYEAQAVVKHPDTVCDSTTPIEMDA